jgi:large repetitive protein
VSFCGTSDGYIIASASGVLPITASLSASFNGAVVLPNTMSNLEVGTYTVYLKDANNCTTTSQIEITKTIPVTASYTIGHIDCFGTTVGSIILDELDPITNEPVDSYLTGGTEPLTWSWAGPNGFSTNSQV